MKILLNGFCGYMGNEVVRAAEKNYGGACLVGGIDLFKASDSSLPVANSFEAAKQMFNTNSADCLIDFSSHLCTKEMIDFAVSCKIPVVIAPTGHTKEELDIIEEASKIIPIFNSANMSLGVALLVKLAKQAAVAMPDAEIEIIEKHHDRKVDAPSGTAMMLFNEIKTVREDAVAVCGRSGDSKRTANEIGIHAIRMGNIVGEHEVIVGTNTQSISLKHEAFDRALFAEGAIVAANFLIKQQPGLYNMHDLIGD